MENKNIEDLYKTRGVTFHNAWIGGSAAHELLMYHLFKQGKLSDKESGTDLEDAQKFPADLEGKAFEELRKLGKLVYVRDKFPEHYLKLYAERWKNITGALNYKPQSI